LQPTPYVKRGNAEDQGSIRGIDFPTNGCADAEAICEAVTRPTMRFVPVTSPGARAALLDKVAPKVRLRHLAQDFLIRQQTQTVNTIRAHLGEFGPSGPWAGRNPSLEGFVRASPHPSSSVVGQGIHDVDRLLEATAQAPEAARPTLDLLGDRLRDLRDPIETVTKRIETARDRPTRSHTVSQQSPASARSPPAPSPSRRSAGTTPPGSASCRSRIPAAARNASLGSPRPATGT
jgi:transposase